MSTGMSGKRYSKLLIIGRSEISDILTEWRHAWEIAQFVNDFEQ
jgi:hypothetical protein